MDRHRGKSPFMRIASIDIGTNTVLLLIADIDSNGVIHPVAFEQRLPRLGKDVDHSGRIHLSAFEKISTVLLEYKEIISTFRVKQIVACGTSAVRDAANRAEFVSYILTTTGITVEILSGEEEAVWTYRGAVSGISNVQKQTAVIDIGGGSTEISYPNPKQHNGHLELNRYSLQLGSVRLTERYLKHNPPAPAEIRSAAEFITEECSQVFNPGFFQYQLVAVAGTATTLACLDQGLKDFDVKKVSSYTMSKERILFWYTKLQSMTTDQIRKLSNAAEGRADILTAGVLILSECMKLFGFTSVQVSERGLRYGLIIRELKKSEQ